MVGAHAESVEAGTVLHAATVLAEALGVRFGEVTIQVSGGDVVLVREARTLKPEDLAAIPLPASP